MNFADLNPFIRSAGLYEVINNTEECRAYDFRLLYMISGDVSVNIEGEKKFHLSAGNLLLIPQGVRYRLKGQYLRLAVITFDLTGERCNLTDRLPPVRSEDFSEEKLLSGDFSPFDKMMILDDAEAERDTFIMICNIATSNEGMWRDEISALVKLMLLKLSESVSDNALPSQMVEALDAYIRENCTDEISNTEIGAIFGYHPFYVSRMLKDKKGITLRQYIISYRLKRSMKMLELTKKSVAEIAEECGFTDSSYFTKTFKANFKMTPKEYRNKFKEEFI